MLSALCFHSLPNIEEEIAYKAMWYLFQNTKVEMKQIVFRCYGDGPRHVMCHNHSLFSDMYAKWNLAGFPQDWKQKCCIINASQDLC